MRGRTGKSLWPPEDRGFWRISAERILVHCRLLEQYRNGGKGVLLRYILVLVEGDDMNEPLADEIRSLLDGHIIVLSRRLAEGHYPAIDVLATLSRTVFQSLPAASSTGGDVATVHGAFTGG